MVSLRLYLGRAGGDPQFSISCIPFLCTHGSYSGGAALGYSGLAPDPAPSRGGPLAGRPVAFPARSGAGRLCLSVTERTAGVVCLGGEGFWSFATAMSSLLPSGFRDILRVTFFPVLEVASFGSCPRRFQCLPFSGG